MHRMEAMADEQQEEAPFISHVGPIDIDWPRSLGFYGGIALALAFELIAPEIALFVAVVPIVKLFKRKRATRPERFVAAVIEGAAKPLGGDAQETVRPRGMSDAAKSGHGESNGKSRRHGSVG